MVLTYPPVPDDEAGALIEWAKKSLITPPGHHLEGRPMALPDYGEKFIRDALAKDCKDSLLCMGRKGGKTAIIAILVLGHLAGPLRRRGWRCALASTSREKESFRRFALSTIAAHLEIVMIEWSRLVSPMKYDLSRLRAADAVSISRAIGSKAKAVQSLVQSGMDLSEALSVVEID